MYVFAVSMVSVNGPPFTVNVWLQQYYMCILVLILPEIPVLTNVVTYILTVSII